MPTISVANSTATLGTIQSNSSRSPLSIPASPHDCFRWSSVSAVVHDSFGYHSCFLLSSPHLLLGTSRGTLLVYSITPLIKLRNTITPTLQIGGVTSIAVSPSSFIAGFQYGDVMIYDKSGNLLRRIEKLSSTLIIHLQVYKGGPDAVIVADGKCNAWVVVVGNGNTERIHDSKIRSTVFDLRVHKSYFAYVQLLNLRITTPYKLAVFKDLALVFRYTWSLRVVQGAFLAWSPAGDVLATSCNSRVVFFDVGDSGVVKGREFEFGESVNQILWLTADILAVLCVGDGLILFSYLLFEKIEQTNVSGLDFLAYDYFSQEGLECQLSYLDCMQAYHKRLFVLTKTGLKAASFVSWQGRLDTLVRYGMFHSAMYNPVYLMDRSELGLEFYDSSHKIAVSGLSKNDAKRMPDVRDAVIGILGSHVGMGLKGRDVDLEEREGHARELAKLCVRVCLRVDARGVLSREIYEYFETAGVEEVFINEVVEAVRMGNVTDLVNPMLVNRICDIVDQGLEDVIVRLDVGCMDIDYVFGVCRGRGLVLGLIYLYTAALRDYQAPVFEVIKAIDGQKSVFVGDKDELVYLLFFYMALSFKGQIFPLGSAMEDEDIVRAKSQIYEVMFSPGYCEVRGNDVRIDVDPPFPYLVLLLKADVGEFLKVLGIGFEDSSLNGNDISMMEISRQFILDAMFSVVEGRGFPESDIVSVFTFALRSLVKYSVFIYFDEALMYHLVSSVMRYKDDATRIERESVILGVLNGEFSVGGVFKDAERLVAICLENKLLRAAHVFCRRLGQYDKIIECCLGDFDAFVILRDVLRGELSYEQGWKIQESLLKIADGFVRADSDETARIVQDYFPSMHVKIVGVLEDEELELEYFESIARVVLGYGADDGRKVKRFEKEVYHRHVELLSKHRPSDVLGYLRFLMNIYENDEPFSKDVVLGVCVEHDILDATGYMYQVLERWSDALGIVLRMWRASLIEIEEGVRVARKGGCLIELFEGVVEARDVDGILFVIGPMIGEVPLDLIFDRVLAMDDDPLLSDHRDVINELFGVVENEIRMRRTGCRLFGVDFYNQRRDYMAKRRKAIVLADAVCAVCGTLGLDEDLVVVGFNGSLRHARCITADVVEGYESLGGYLVEEESEESRRREEDGVVERRLGIYLKEMEGESIVYRGFLEAGGDDKGDPDRDEIVI